MPENLLIYYPTEYLYCRWPYMREVDFIVNGKVRWRSVGFRMAIDEYYRLKELGIDSFMFPHWQTPEEYNL